MEYLKNQDTRYELAFLHDTHTHTHTHTLPQIVAVAEANLASTVLQGLEIRLVQINSASPYRGNCAILQTIL
jgi:hypothetical protein